ncbi:MAG: 16S rRNA (uracil(1498)-N(3))-methyltransferase [bacterium]|nr:16S rRNA (uracil(1498)-N(3))-methyltransferase [bacterium]
MAVFRILMEKLPDVGRVCPAPPNQAHHLLRVRRLTPRDHLECLDRQGWACTAEIVQSDNKGLSFRLVGEPRPPSPRPQLRVCISLLPEAAFSLVLQKCTELGAAECQPLMCDFTVARLHPNELPRKLARWQRICDEAAVQSGSAPMRVLQPCSTAQLWPTAAPLKLLADTAGSSSPPAPPASGQLLLVAIGPEAGFSPSEHTAALQHGWLPFRLASHTLRAETAAIAACARLLIPAPSPA